ncbi:MULTISPECIES: YraN family protein [unclassified Limnobacter]|uniref:YraN family protein n=1 Tax=unclassified Limnobacter TaxID=2630203 RepID=UPI000C50188F|nr:MULTISPECIES: YraN family protein [unclassified Limnobacter]MAG82287.1 YraN family protein [Sutterellaceae bacterium]MBT84877.1 YraN family protein [Sutterellaceae bacterium]HAV73616.1 YraN family protein [Limnobacter sp.]|tara:strand:- start:17831 stop:18334 length:504 start_codon:yes stop_codon:yes gene_type:complete
MALKSKSKVPELSGIPWGRRKSRSPKAKIPWLTPKEKPDTTNRRPPTHKIAVLAEGQLAETQALRLLERHGLILVTRNHRCRCGEIDLIMAHGNTAVVVEVRLRNNSRHGSALESISSHKQARVSRCAKLWWMQQGQRKFTHLRFDVVALENGTEPQWVQNAWQISN